MSHYYKLFPIYQKAQTWREFLEEVSQGTGKWSLLQALEAGWRGRIHSDLCTKYRVLPEEADVLLNRYECIVKTRPVHSSTQELTLQLAQCVEAANMLRAYFRYAYYVRADEPDTIFTVLDEHLTDLGAGTPTRDECAKSYTAITGQHVNPDAVVLAADKADEIADHLAAETEYLQKRLSQMVDTSPKSATKLVSELERVDQLHVSLTGKSLIDKTAMQEMRDFLTCTKTSSAKNDSA